MDLERLISAEERNEAIIAAARMEAEGIVAAATAAAATREAALQEAIAVGVVAAERALDAERVRRIADLREAARRTRARYDEVTDDRIDAVVPALVDQLLAGEGV